MTEPVMDRLTGQLYHLPSIIGRLGVSVANAQKQLNADYVENVKKLLKLINRTLGSDAADASDQRVAAVRSLLESLAPSRYQFTETTLDFSADLAETLDKTVAAGAGFGFGAITVNAAFSIGYGYDYRAAARVTTVLHAYQANPEETKKLLDRAATVRSGKLSLPQLSSVEKEIWDSTAEIFNSLSGKEDDKDVKPVDAANPE